MEDALCSTTLTVLPEVITAAMARFACVFLAALFLLNASTTEAGLTAADKKALLGQHNRVRSIVYPNAGNMRLMYWDDQLADIAQGWANHCHQEHNAQRSDNYPGSVGENIATIDSSSRSDIVTQVWSHEQDYYANTDCNRHRQLYWAESDKVGCGRASCSGGTDTVVCNYSPSATLYTGSSNGCNAPPMPYLVAKSTCSSCPSGASHCVYNLCYPGGPIVG